MVYCISPFHPKFLKCPLPTLNSDMSTVTIRGASQKPKTELQCTCRSRRDRSIWAVWSGSTQFAKLSILVYRAARVNWWQCSCLLQVSDFLTELHLGHNCFMENGAMMICQGLGRKLTITYPTWAGAQHFLQCVPSAVWSESSLCVL